MIALWFCEDTGRALVERLPGGRLGWSQTTEDGCMAAAVATLLQVPIAAVPDARYDEQIAAGVPAALVTSQAIADMAVWAAGRGLRMRFHHPPPVELDWWIGVCPDDEPGQSHVVVCDRDMIVFDPAASWPCPPGCHVAEPGPVAYGITFDPVGDR